MRAMIAAACLAAATAAGPVLAAVEETVECPPGTHHVETGDPYVPFKCVSTADENKKGFDSVVGSGFKTRPRCPHGTRPVEEAGNSLQPYRCVRASSGSQDPELAPVGVGAADEAAGAEAAPSDPTGCPKGKRKVRTNDPLEPYHCVSQSSRLRALDETSYGRFSIPHAISFDYPSAFRVQDSWKEEVPTLYLKLDDDSAGKPVTITITRYVDTESTYQELSEAITHDVEWQGAKDGGAQTVAGRRARVTYVPSDTRSVYLPATKESYYSFVYSAPADAYELYLPAFSRLLRTLKLGSSAR